MRGGQCTVAHHEADLEREVRHVRLVLVRLARDELAQRLDGARVTQRAEAHERDVQAPRLHAHLRQIQPDRLAARTHTHTL